MIQSMTGFGEARTESGGIDYTVEIKSVNNRYLKTMVRVPDSVAFMEQEIENLLRENLTRGTINYNLRMKNVSDEVLFDIDDAAVKVMLSRLEQFSQDNRLNCTVDLSGLLLVPGVIQPVQPREEKANAIRATVIEVSQKALENLRQMRSTEGQTIADDLAEHCKVIGEDLEQIRSRSGQVMQEYRDKLQKRVDELLAGASLKLDEETLAREVAVYADRADIREEISRLDSHLKQLMQTCKDDAVAGRRLDFISQEMLREANTIASKASDTGIIQIVVDIKCRIDSIKEQVQNIE